MGKSLFLGIIFLYQHTYNMTVKIKDFVEKLWPDSALYSASGVTGSTIINNDPNNKAINTDSPYTEI